MVDTQVILSSRPHNSLRVNETQQKQKQVRLEPFSQRPGNPFFPLQSFCSICCLICFFCCCFFPPLHFIEQPQPRLILQKFIENKYKHFFFLSRVSFLTRQEFFRSHLTRAGLLSRSALTRPSHLLGCCAETQFTSAVTIVITGLINK